MYYIFISNYPYIHNERANVWLAEDHTLIKQISGNFSSGIHNVVRECVSRYTPIKYDSKAIIAFGESLEDVKADYCIRSLELE